MTDAVEAHPVVALVDDLMDRSRIAAALPDVVFVRGPDLASLEGLEPSVVVIDLGRRADAVAPLRHRFPDARIVAFGAHGDDDVLDEARAAGADRVLARSRFFRDPLAAVAPDAAS